MKSSDNTVVAYFVTSLLAVLTFVPVLGGTLSLLHLVAISMIPLSFTSLARQYPGARKLLLLGIFWSVAQVLVDYFSGVKLLTSFALSATALASTVYLLLYVSKHFSITEGRILAGVALGWLGRALIFGEWQTSLNAWKYVLGTPLAVLVLSVVLRRNFWTKISALGCLAALSLLFDSRIYAITFAIGGFLLLLDHRESNSRFRRSEPRSRLVVLLAVLGLLAFAFPWLSALGVFGVRSATDSVMSLAAGDNPLLTARLELPFMLVLGIAHLPFGIGTYGILGTTDVYAALNFINTNFQKLTESQTLWLVYQNPNSTGYQPHSYFGASLLFSGLLCVPFFLSYAKTLLSSFDSTYRTSVLSGVAAPLALLALWDMLFSGVSSSILNWAVVAIFCACKLTDRQIT